MRKWIEVISEAQRLDELWNTAGSFIKWKKNADIWRGSFSIADASYEVKIDRGFVAFNKNSDPFAEYETGTVGQALPVFASVIRAICQYLQEVKPLKMFFHGGSPSRTKLYTALLKRWQQVITGAGYQLAQHDNAFVITRKLVTEGEHTPPTHEDGDEAHYDALDRTGFFGEQAAGCIPMSRKTGRFMLVKRSAQVEQPGTWGNLGGAHHADETPEAAAQRELLEESGYSGPVKMFPLLVFSKGSFKYCNFLAIINDEFTPGLGWEADAFKWCTLEDLPQPLHFGVEALLNDANSYETIRKYHEGLKNENQGN